MMEDNQSKAKNMNTGKIDDNQQQETKDTSTVAGNRIGQESPSASNGDRYKLMAVVGYVVPFLFFIPLLTEASTNKFSRYHANQQLLLLLFWIIGQIIASILMFVLIGALLYLLVFIVGVIFMVIGIINVLNGEMKQLPILGKYEFIK